MNATVQIEPITSSATFVVEARQVPKRPVDENLSDAIMQYIQAVRRLGKTRVSTRDIADALDLPHEKILMAVRSLRSQGVKHL